MADSSLILPRGWRRADVLAASVSINLLALALPVVVLQVYDRVVPLRATETFAMLILGVVAAIILEGFLRGFRSVVLNWVGAKYEHRQGLDSIDHMLDAATLDFEKSPSGAFLEKFQNLEQIKDFYAGPPTLVLVDLPFSLLFLLLVFTFAGWMALIPVVLLFVFFFVSWRTGAELREVLARKASIGERRQNFIVEMLRGIHTLKSMAMEEQILRRYERLQEESAECVYHLSRISSIHQALGATLSQFVTVSFVSVGSVLVLANELTIGALAAGTMLAGRILQPGLQAMGLWSQYQSVRLAKEKLQQIADLPSESQDVRIHSLRGCKSISLSNVCFRYDSKAPFLIKDLSLHMEPGETVGITGANGTGKSTLLAAILGYLHPDHGTIEIGGHDLRYVDPRVLRAHVGILPQKGVLFKGTILENMTLFREGVYVERAILLAQKIGLDEIITRLPFGLDTQIGGTAVDTLPEGVRQKIIMVRALVTDPEIILFDDANANHDLKDDRLLLEVIKEYQRNHTTIIVSHRPSYLKLCDRRFLLSDGALHPLDVEELFSAPAASMIASVS